jgi:hypothetical protein
MFRRLWLGVGTLALLMGLGAPGQVQAQHMGHGHMGGGMHRGFMPSARFDRRFDRGFDPRFRDRRFDPRFFDPRFNGRFFFAPEIVSPNRGLIIDPGFIIR